MPTGAHQSSPIPAVGWYALECSCSAARLSRWPLLGCFRPCRAFGSLVPPTHQLQRLQLLYERHTAWVTSLQVKYASECDAAARVHSASMLQRRSSSGGPLLYRDGPVKAPHLAPHGRPSFTMADVGRVAASTRAVRGCSDGSCPGISPDNFHQELLDDRPQPEPRPHGI